MRCPGQESFTVEDHVLSVRAACAEFLLNGVTCIADRLGNMDRIAPGIEASGIRAVVGHSLVDARAPADWKTADAVIERYGTDPRRRVFAGIAPHALDTCSDALLTECARRAEKTGARVFIHVAQNEPEVAAVRRRGHDGALACLVATGLADAQHRRRACDLSQRRGIRRLAGPRHRHRPLPGQQPQDRGADPAAGAPGRAACRSGSAPTGPPRTTPWTCWPRRGWRPSSARCGPTIPQVLPVQQMVRMLTIDGARVLGLDGLTGSIEAGKRADLVVFDGNRLEATPAHDPAANLIYSLNPRAVRDVLVDGALLVRDGKLTWDDEAALARQQRTRGAANPR